MDIITNMLLFILTTSDLSLMLWENVYKFKLQGTAPSDFLLGCDYYREIPTVKRILLTLSSLREETNACYASSLLVKGDHPECDTSELLEEREVKIYH
jgi:hypothetical protein